ncbi:MAG: hypothetical protein IPM77_13805 [Crocinitomicaceae bacterium]|nr:hypothetical protein [Crocinitomicaceae bacterium]
MKTFICISVVTCICFLGSAPLFAQESPSVAAQKIIQQKDLDVDGVLCLMECPPEISNDFKLIDEDKDGFLSENEITKYLQNKSVQKKEK